MEYKLYDSERKVMEVLWDGGDMSAKELSQRLQAQVGWSKSTTYTILKKCIDKQILARTDPGFLCHALVSREEVQERENGHPEGPFGVKGIGEPGLVPTAAAIAGEVERLKKCIEEWE